eukprot:TRINITY_DN10567_c0_g1_i1.p1 TRINITY_DN10567_c0_g1~~TRINITY_DN10567_c0_g1_i1.p1  ORF type:complete len:612 (+),score=152.58 TRINITY_DN10567_c0_g1_i1:138-1973(+)
MLIPRLPKEQPPQPRGGFFRALGFARLNDPLLNADKSTVVPSSSSRTGPLQGATVDLDDAVDALADTLKPQQHISTAEELSAREFLEKLQLKFIEKLWVEIKKNCMKTSASGRSGAAEMIELGDFLKLSRKLMTDHTPQDDIYLEQLFNRVDRRKKGAIRTTDIATALVLISNSDPIPKLRSLFRVFDSDDDSCLMHDEIFDMYLSIKVNDVTRPRDALMADALFEDELSLQEAKRLYELTVTHLKAVSDFIIFDEFKHIFDERSENGRFLLENLLPGAFSLEWILGASAEPPTLDGDQFGTDVRRRLVETLRRGEEHLNLGRRRGRGMRIMQNCLNTQPHRPAEAPAAGSREGSQGPGDATAGEARRGDGARDGAGGGGISALPKLSSAPDTKPSKSATRSTISSGSGGAHVQGGTMERVPTTAGGAGQGGRKGSPKKGAQDKVSKEKMSASKAAGEAQLAEGQTTATDAFEDDDSASDSDSSDDDERLPGQGGKGAAELGRGGGFGGGGGAGTGGHGAMPGRMHHHGHSSTTAGGGTYVMEEVLRDMPLLPVIKYQHEKTKQFRNMTTSMDAKSKQAFLRDKKDVNRTLRYQCLVCAVNHDFKLNKVGG